MVDQIGTARNAMCSMEAAQRRLSLLSIATVEAVSDFITEIQRQWAVGIRMNGPRTVKQRRLLKQDGSSYPITHGVHQIIMGTPATSPGTA